MSDFPTVNKPWYKRGWGVVLLVILGFLILGALGFMALFGYYAWQIKYGSNEKITKINQQFTKELSTSGLLAKAMISQAQVSNYLDYVRKNNPSFGNPKAKIVVLTFIDFQCPYCQASFADFKQLMNRYEPVVKFVFKNVPLTDIHPEAMDAAKAAMCANAQGKFWLYHDYLFTTKQLDQSSLLKAGEVLGLDKNKFIKCFTDNLYKNDIDQDLRDALAVGVKGTPTYLINGVKLEGVVSPDQWDKIILEFLK